MHTKENILAPSDHLVKKYNLTIEGNLDAAQTMIFAHGFGSDQTSWRFVKESFKHDYRLVLFDNIGGGESDRDCFSPLKYSSLHVYASDLLEITSNLAISDAIVVAHSVSSMVSMLAGIKNPERFSKLVFIGASPRYLNDGDYYGGFEQQDLDALYESITSNYYSWVSGFAMLGMANPDKPELGREFAATLCKLRPDIAVSVAKTIFQSDLRAELSKVQIELKRSGIEIKEAFNQINRYQRHSFWSHRGLFQYVQLFVISNGVNTKYLANNKLQSVKQTFFWADEHNRNITGLPAFTDAFLHPHQLGKFISHYVVMNETFKNLMVLRPYQYYAAEAIIKQVMSGNDNGYIWHTTGSGKTLTSFKASQILMDLPQVQKVVFVVDRKDLDYQTMTEFNAFKKDSVDVTDNTASLVRQLTDDTKLVLTTIQKLNNAITKAYYETSLGRLKDKKIVFIFDECHRSQFGETHDRIIKYFSKAQLFGFTGTPIFADNANKNELGKRTTKDLFGQCLHKYVITDAIRDQNVLRFGIEYLGRYRQKGNTFIDIEVEDIDKAEVLNSAARMEKIADYIIQYHDQKTFNRAYSALFAISSIDNLTRYYEIFKRKKDAGEHDLRIATIFTFGTNEDDDDAQDYLPSDEEMLSMAADPQVAYGAHHTRDKLEGYISDYNKLYGTSFSTKDSQSFENYFKDISKRLKEREKENFNHEKDRIDLVLVVNMMLTGFDAKKLNTLYVDKSLKHHGLIQAYSRTNRTLGEQKSQGNILAFRNLKKATDDAITLFSNKEAIEEIILPSYDVILDKFKDALEALYVLTPTWQHVDLLPDEEAELAFVQAFRALLRIRNVLASYADFTWEDLGITEQDFENYKSKYLDLYDKVKREHEKEKVSILNDVDFELELIHRDQINVAYILKLLAKLKAAKTPTDAEKQRKQIIDMLGGDIELRSKRELIEKFIQENLPLIHDADNIDDEFEKYWQEQKVLALGKLCEEEHLDQEQFKALIDAYIFSGVDPLRDEVLRCLGNRPSILKAREIGERIIGKMKEYVEVFERGMVA